MTVKGIDEEKCTGCGQCVKDCTRLNFTMDKERKKVIFSPLRCLDCGHEKLANLVTVGGGLNKSKDEN